MTLRFPLSGVFLSGAFSLFTLLATRTAHAQDSFRTYHNARFGTTVIYPANLVVPRPESDNGDGRKFVSSDGQIELTVYGSHNIWQKSARSEMARAMTDWKRDGARLTYAKGGSSWFALSGYLGADIFYEKTLLRNGVFHTMLWQYPKALKQRLDTSVSRSVATFSVGKSLESALAKSSQAYVPKAKPTPIHPNTPRPISKPRISPRYRATPRANSSSGGY